MSELSAKLRISVDGKDEVASFFAKTERGARGFRETLSSELGRAGRDVATLAGSIVRSLGALGGIGAGLGIADQGREVLELRDQVTGLAATAGLAEDRIGDLKDQILQTSSSTRQFGKDLTEALNTFVAKTGDIEAGRKNLELYGKVATATRASVGDIASLGAELSKLKLKDQGGALAILAKQSDEGQLELRDMVTQGPRIISAIAGAGLTGESALRRGGALFQAVRGSTGTTDMATTAFERMFADVALHADRVKSLGVDVFDPKTHASNDRIDVLLDVIRKTKGREDIRRKIFGEESIRGALALGTDYDENGRFTKFDQFANVKADMGLIDSKFALNTSTGMSKLKAMQIDTTRSADRNLGGALEFGADKSGVLSGLFDVVTAHPGLALGGLVLGKAGVNMAGGALSKAGGALLSKFVGGKVGGAAGGLVAGAMTDGGAAPVRVVNWPTNALGIGGDAASTVGDKIAGGVAPAVKTAAAGLLRTGVTEVFAGGLTSALAGALGVAAAGAVGFQVGRVIDKWLDLSGHLSGTAGSEDGKAHSQKPKAGATAPPSEAWGVQTIMGRERAHDAWINMGNNGVLLPNVYREDIDRSQLGVAQNVARKLKAANWIRSQGRKVNYGPEQALQEFDAFVGKSGGAGDRTESMRAALAGGDSMVDYLAGHNAIDFSFINRSVKNRPAPFGTDRSTPVVEGPPRPGLMTPSSWLPMGEQVLSQLGQQLKAAFSPEQIAKQMNLQIVVNVDGDGATAEATMGGRKTRSVKQMSRRLHGGA